MATAEAKRKKDTKKKKKKKKSEFEALHQRCCATGEEEQEEPSSNDESSLLPGGMADGTHFPREVSAWKLGQGIVIDDDASKHACVEGPLACAASSAATPLEGCAPTRALGVPCIFSPKFIFCSSFLVIVRGIELSTIMMAPCSLYDRGPARARSQLRLLPPRKLHPHPSCLQVR